MHAFWFLFVLRPNVSTIAHFIAQKQANSFATTVASRALTLGKVVILAGIMEFAGAVLLGAGVTSTIKSGIARLSVFQAVPDVAMFGFLAVSVTTAFWDNTASYLALPVSMTHTTVGATVGMSLALFGGGAVIWSEDKDEFPYIGGMVPIFLSWVISPIMCGLITVILFGTIRQFVLRSEHSFARAFYVLPFMVFGTAWLITSFIIQTGAKNDTWDDRGDGFAAWVGAVCGIGSGLFTLFIIMPRLKKRILDQEHVDSLANVGHESSITDKDMTKDPESGNGESSDGEKVEAAPKLSHAELHALKYAAKDKPWKEKTLWEKIEFNPVSNILLHNVRQDIHSVADNDDHVKMVHDNAEVFDAKSESLFRYLQVFSACVMSFTHGANDVSNAMGPFAAIYQIWKSGEVPKSAPTPEWVLVIGGVGISVGLAVFGWRIIQILGVKTVKITNVRGFCAELATGITVAVASRYGLPVSTTMTITGGLLGVGMLEGLKGINYRVMLRIFSGWILTLFVACGVAAGVVAFGSYAPYKPGSVAIADSSEVFNATNTAMLAQMQAALNAASNAADADSIQQTIASLNSTFYEIFGPTVKSIDDMVNNNAAILGEFNATLAWNPFEQTPGLLVPQ